MCYRQIRIKTENAQSCLYLREYGRGERKQREFLCPLSWSVHNNFSGDGNSEYATVAVQVRFLDKGNKKNAFVKPTSTWFLCQVSGSLYRLRHKSCQFWRDKSDHDKVLPAKSIYTRQDCFVSMRCIIVSHFHLQYSVVDPDLDPDPDPYRIRIFGASRIQIRIRHYFVQIRILPSTSTSILWLFFDFLSVKVISKNTYFLLSLCQPLKKKAGSGPINQWYRSADPDPYQNITDPQH